MNKIALVTGSNRGIGLEVVNQLAKQGMKVILTSRNEEDGEQAIKDLDHENVSYHQLDISDSQSIENIRKWLEKDFGKLDILINNAGINYDTWNKVEAPDMKNVRQTFETNFFGTWEMCVAMIPLLKKSGSGRIVNVSSGAGSLNEMQAEAPGYSFSKVAINGLTIQLANRLKREKILVNAVCPGWVRTDMGGLLAPRSVEEGAEGIVELALIPDNGPTGGFFRDGKPIQW